MRSRRRSACALVACALLGDAAIGALWPATARPALLPIAAVAGIALAGGARAGMVGGFATGLVLDLLAGPASVAGVHTLIALLVGAAVGSARRDPRHSTAGFAALAGALAVAVAAVSFMMLQRALGYAGDDGLGTVVAQALVAGAITTPIARRVMPGSVGWPLSQVSTRP